MTDTAILTLGDPENLQHFIYVSDYNNEKAAVDIFITENANNDAIEYIWKYVITECLKDGAIISNANAREDNTALGVAISEKVGLIKTAKKLMYSK